MSWRDQWRSWRNRRLSDPGFQRLALRVPLIRGVARARARELFDIVAGFTYSQTLAACVELGLIDMLAAAPLDAATIATRAGLPLEATDRLLRAARALKLTEQCDDSRWTLGTHGAAMRGNGGIAEMVAHHHLLYGDIADPVAALRRRGGGALSAFWRYAEHQGSGTSAEIAPYSALMAASQPLIAEHVISAYDFRQHSRMLDIGGGEGRFIRAVGAAAPALDFGLFDLPAVGDRARAALEAAGMHDRVTIHPGSFLADPLPQGYDLITLIRVLHDHDDAPVEQLLRSIAAALARGNRLLIAEPMAETPGAEGAGDAYFGWYLWAMGSGRPRSMSTIAAMLRAAGFAEVRPIGTPLPLTVRAIVAVR